MRKLSVVALAGILTLVVAAVAVAAGGSATSGTTVQNYDQAYSAKKPGKPTGTTFSTSSTDDQNADHNKQPKRVTNFDIKFPAGSKIDNKAAPACKATDEDFANAETPDAACPKGSRLGKPGTTPDGKVKARTPFNGVADFEGEVFAYNAPKGLLLYVNVQSANQTLVLRPKFSGLNLKTAVPQTCIPPNRPDQDCKPNGQGESQEAILTEFSLKTIVKSSGKGKKKRTLIKTPPTCPKGTWKFTSSIKYDDGTSVRIPSTTPCTK
jgi:hypothetical protein